MSKESELELEQKYFDNALDCREQSRATLGTAPAKAPHKGAAANLRKVVERQLEALRPPEEAVAFSRFDTSNDSAVYVGYNAIWDDEHDLLVVNWQAPEVSPLYESTPQDPGDVTRRRTFSCDGNSVIDFEDLEYALIAAEVAELVAPPEMDDALLSDLERGRTGEMQDIVRTIQAAQHKVIRSDLNQLLIVQGGPGTGKTAVALHRVSWLLFNYRDSLSPEDVLVLGPSRAFVRYIRGVLPMLGDRDVRQAQLPQLLATGVRVSRVEAPMVAHLKGEKRMEELIKAALEDRVRIPEGDITLRGRGIDGRLDQAQLRQMLERIPVFPYGTGRQRLRDAIRDNAADYGSTEPTSESLDAVVDRIWPQLTSAAFVQDLLGSEGRLLRAAGDHFTASEVQLLYRQSADRLANEQWSSADVGLLDYADFLIKGGAPRTYDHIVVDEVQDLSPLQLGMIRRRSPKGSITALGDIAQSTGPWARDDWSQVLVHLDGELPHAIEELEFGYRVPRQIYELAARLLPEAAPAVTPPRVVREGLTEPELVLTESNQVANQVVAAARNYASLGNLVGVICAAARRSEVEEALSQAGVQWADASAGEIGPSITLLDPTESKGLEFDAVVVVEPNDVIEQDVRGHRLLYVALTRPTRHLSIVYSLAPLPFEQGAKGPEGDASQERPVTDAPQEINSLLEAVSVPLADQIRSTVQPHLWKSVVEEIERQLSD